MTAERLWVSANEAGDLWVLRDDEGRPAALIERTKHAGIDLGDGTTTEPAWYSYAVAWSRSGTLYPGDFRSNDLETTCREVLEWESTPVHRDLVTDHQLAAERLRLAALEFGHLDGRVRAELTARPTLPRKARPRSRGRRGGRRRELDQEEVIAELVDLMNVEGVQLSPRAGILDRAAAHLEVRRDAITALWPSESAMTAAAMLALAREGLRRRADDDALIATWNFLAREAHRVMTVDGRHGVLADLILLVAQHNFETGTTSTPWRNYVACVASVAEDDELSERLTTALRASEEEFLAQLSGFYSNVLSLIGFTLAPELRGDHRAFAVAVSSLVEGLGLARRNVPDVVAASYGVGEEHSIASLLLSVLLNGLLVEDPDFDPPAAIERLTKGLVDLPVQH